jgi:hypothetical protein
MIILGKFGIKSILFLYLYSYILFTGVFLNFFKFPHFILVGSLAYIAAYHAACGRLAFPSVVYGIGLGVLALDSVYPPSRVFGPLPIDVGWTLLYTPPALAILLLYAAAYAKGLAKRVLSVALLTAALLAGHFYMVYAGMLWRALVPAIGLAPVFPEPQDFPLYILLYELWRVIHQKPLKLNCQRQTT